METRKEEYSTDNTPSIEDDAKNDIIPKILHYVWMGKGEKSELMNKCIESWSRVCPDYEIREWNEMTFDTQAYPFVSRALEAKNWALAADYIRVWALKNYGGIYLDTDVELTMPLDTFLENDFFIGYESDLWLNPATFGSTKEHPILERLLERLEKTESINFSTNPLTVHAYGVVLKMMYGLKLNGKTVALDKNIRVFSKDYFCPQNYMTKSLCVTQNTHAIHHYTNTWFSKSQRKGANFAMSARKLLGRHIFKLFERIVGNHYKRVIIKEYKRIDREKW